MSESPKARPPVGPGRLTALGVIWSVLLVGLGAVGVRDGLISADVLGGKSTLERGVDLLDGLEPQWWAVAAGIVCVLLGLWLLAVALWPRPRPYQELSAATPVYLRRRDVPKLAAHTAEDIDGVLAVHARNRRRGARLDVVVTGEDPAIAEAVRTTVDARLKTLTRPPRLAVRQRAGEAP